MWTNYPRGRDRCQSNQIRKVTSMSTPPRQPSSLSIYHVIYRGNNKQRIFEDSDDYGKFLAVVSSPVLCTGITKNTSVSAIFSRLGSWADRSTIVLSSLRSLDTFIKIRSKQQSAVTLISINIVAIRTILTTIWLTAVSFVQLSAMNSSAVSTALKMTIIAWI